MGPEWEFIVLFWKLIVTSEWIKSSLAQIFHIFVMAWLGIT